MLLQKILGSDKIDMFQWITGAPDEICLDPSILDDDSISEALYYTLLQRAAAPTQTIFASLLYRAGGNYVLGLYRLYSKQIC